MFRSRVVRSFSNTLHKNRLVRLKKTSAATQLPPTTYKFDDLGELKFAEEPLGVTPEQGYGFPRFEFGESIGPDGRFKLVRKLGFGRNSSTWLALYEPKQKYVAIKALTGYATFLTMENLSWELSALKSLSSPESLSPHCLSLHAHFGLPGKEKTDGYHLCLVTDVMGGDVQSLRRNLGGKNWVLPLPLVKRILLHTLRGIAHLHSCGVVHTDLKDDNIMFSAKSVSLEDIDAILAADPPRLNPPEQSVNGTTVQSAVSQPLPLPSIEDAMTRTYVLSDFGSAQSPTDHKTDFITPDGLRAPETILRGPWNEKVDIWIFGCLVFEFAVGNSLFVYKKAENFGLDEEGHHLWQMMCFSGEQFTTEQLQVSQRAGEYFDSTGQLKSHPPGISHPYELSMRNYKVLKESEIRETAAFLRRCLRLDPTQRPSAKELLDDPWWRGVDSA